MERNKVYFAAVALIVLGVAFVLAQRLAHEKFKTTWERRWLQLACLAICLTIAIGGFYHTRLYKSPDGQELQIEYALAAISFFGVLIGIRREARSKIWCIRYQIKHYAEGELSAEDDHTYYTSIAHSATEHFAKILRHAHAARNIKVAVMPANPKERRSLPHIAVLSSSPKYLTGLKMETGRPDYIFRRGPVSEASRAEILAAKAASIT